MQNKNELLKQLNKLNREIESLENFISNCPEETLITRTLSSGVHKYYAKQEDENGKIKEHYLNHNQRSLAETLAKKEYALACIKDKKNERWFIEQTIAHEERESKAEQLLRTKPGIAALILPTLKDFDDIVTKWESTEYIRSNLNPEHLIVPTVIPGLFVRSKSESLITSCLTQKGIPLRYEEENHFGDIVLHPDFTCMNPRTHNIFYLEHYGRMDDPAYIRKQRWREDQYRKAGIYPWKNLLITTETDSQPLDVRWLEKIIDYYLL